MFIEDVIMELVWFFAGLFACLAFAFLCLRIIGVSSERIGRGVARVVHVLVKAPGVRRLLAFSRLHRKAAGWVGTVLVICFAPFALMGVVIVVGSVVAIYAFGYLSQFVGVEDKQKSDGYIYYGVNNEFVLGCDGDLVPRDSGEAWKPPG